MGWRKAAYFFSILALFVLGVILYGHGAGEIPKQTPAFLYLHNGTHTASEINIDLQNSSGAAEQAPVGDHLFGVRAPATTASGRVVDQEGRPVSDANVFVIALESKDSSEGRTGRDGRFSIAVTDTSQTLEFSVEKIGYIGEVLRLESDEAIALPSIELVVAPAGFISGTVASPSGVLLAGASVFLLPGPGALGLSHVVRKTDENGFFTYEAVPIGEYTVVASIPWVQEPPPTDGPEAVRVVLATGKGLSGIRLIAAKHGLEISGRVVDSSGGSLQDALVSAVAVPGYTNVAVVRSDASGAYVLPGLEDRPYHVLVQSPPLSTDGKPDIPAGSVGVNFVLQERGSIEGQVLDGETKEPVVGFEIAHRHSQDPKPNQFLKFRQVTDLEGRFRIGDVDAGESTIFLRAQDYLEAGFSMPPVSPGRTSSENILYLQRGLYIRGVVLSPEGEAVQGAQIIIDDGSLVAYRSADAVAQTDSAGEFIVRRLRDSEYVVVASHERYASGTIRAFPSSSSVVEISLGVGATIEGIVATGGVPEKGAAILVETQRIFTKSTQTDEHGRFKILGIQPGRASIRAQLGFLGTSKYRSQVQEIEVSAGGSTRVDFDFKSANAALEGTIYGVEGNPVAADIILRIDSGSGPERFASKCNDDGIFRFENLPSGQGEIAVQFSGLVQRRVAVSILEGEVVSQDIYLNSGFSVNCELQLPAIDFDKVWVLIVSGNFHLERADTSILNNLLANASATAESYTGESILLSGLEAGTYSIVAWIDTAGFRQTHPPEERARLALARPISTTIVTLDKDNQTPTIQVSF